MAGRSRQPSPAANRGRSAGSDGRGPQDSADHSTYNFVHAAEHVYANPAAGASMPGAHTPHNDNASWEVDDANRCADAAKDLTEEHQSQARHSAKEEENLTSSTRLWIDGIQESNAQTQSTRTHN